MNQKIEGEAKMKTGNICLQKKKIYRLIFSFLLLFSLLSLININHAQEIKIRVTAKRADVRLEPKPSSVLVAIVSAGIVVTPIEKTGAWYFVELPPNEEGDVIAGYIHQSQVEEIYTEQKQEEIREKERTDRVASKGDIKEKAQKTEEIKAKEEPVKKREKTIGKKEDIQAKNGEFVLTDELFEPWDKVDCTTHVAFSGYENGSFRVGTKNIENGKISKKNGKLILWGYGARHTWIGRVVYKGYIFQSDEDNPLQFKIVKDEGYKYLKGKGSVTFPNGKKVSLPIYKDKEVKAKEEEIIEEKKTDRETSEVDVNEKEEKLTAESLIKIISARRAERINTIRDYHTAKNPKENVLLVLRINNISKEEFDGASERKEIYITDGQNQYTPGITSVSYIFGESKKACYIFIFGVPRTILKFKFIISDYSVSFEADKEIADQLSMSELCK